MALDTDGYYLRAAEGWLQLGDVKSARGELINVSLETVMEPEGMSLLCRLTLKEEKWDQTLAISETLLALHPELLWGWIFKSASLHKLHRTHEALASLSSVAGKFLDHPGVGYDLAVYNLALGNRKPASQWLEWCLQMADLKGCRAFFLKVAEEEGDLKPLLKQAN